MWYHNCPESSTDYIEERKLMLGCNHLDNILDAQAKNSVVLAPSSSSHHASKAAAKYEVLTPKYIPKQPFLTASIRIILDWTLKRSWDLQSSPNSLYSVCFLFSTQQQNGPFIDIIPFPHVFHLTFKKNWSPCYGIQGYGYDSRFHSANQLPTPQLNLLLTTHWIWQYASSSKLKHFILFLKIPVWLGPSSPSVLWSIFTMPFIISCYNTPLFLLLSPLAYLSL